MKKLDQIIEEIENTSDIVFYHYIIKKKNPDYPNAKNWPKAGTLPCLQKGEGDTKGTDSLKKRINEATWGGPGAYQVSVYDEDDRKVDELGSFTIAIDADPNEIKKEKGKEKEKEVNMADIKRMLIDDIALGQLRKTRKELMKDLEDKEEEKGDPLTAEEIEEIIYQTMEREDRKKQEMEKEKERKSEQENNNSQILQLLQKQQDFISNSISNKKEPDMLTPIVTLITAQNKLEAEQNREMMRSLQAPKNDTFTPVVNLIIEQNKNATEQNQKMMKMVYESQQQNSIGLIQSVISSPVVAKFVQTFTEKKESSLEQMIPNILERTTNSFSDFQTKAIELIMEQQINPPVSPKDKLTQQLQFMTGLKNLAIPAIKDIVKILATLKNEKKENPAVDNNNNISSDPNTLPVKRETEEEKAKKQVVQETTKAIEILKSNAKLDAIDIANLLIEEAPSIIAIIETTPEQEILTQLKTYLTDEELNKVSEIKEILETNKNLA